MKKTFSKQTIFNILSFVVLPFIINIVLESLGIKDLLHGFEKLFADPYIFLCNTLIISSTLSIGVFFKRFRVFWLCLVSFCWIALGTVNYFILCNRTLPFTAYDLRLFNSLPNIIKKYLSPFLLAVVCLGLVAVILGIFIVFFKALESPKKKTNFIKQAAYFVFTILLTFTNLKYAVNAGVLETRFPELAGSFVKNGFAYSFTVSIMDNGINKVDGYSEKLITSITAEFEESDAKQVKTPNVIFVQMESFFDLNSLSSVEFSENPVPNFTKLKDECQGGLLTVPVIGAGTANTEFEVVTGMRISDFGAGEYPYKTILTDTACESIATNLKNHGYTSHFIHNYKGSFYGRNKVYSYLGYDNFISLEYMSGYKKNGNGWAEDLVLTKYIEECLNSTEGSDLITTISVQGHGGYSGVSDFERHVTVTKCEKEYLHEAYEYYANQIYEMDTFIGKLIDTVSSRSEETIVVIYGDHLPSLEIENDDLSSRTIYQTDYIIWNNMGIEYSEENIGSYQLNSKILESINVKDGIINACHQYYKNDKQYLYNLKALEYDMLYGKHYAFDGNNPYVKSDMSINQRKMTIYDIKQKSDDSDIYVINGEGFTQASLVRIGYRIVSTHYIDENTLAFRCTPHDSEKAIAVWEKDAGSSNTVMIESK